VEIITKRYDWQKPLAITSNLSIAEIGNRYGERVADRIREMAEVITIKGNSYR
jgi:DNA replication protein DnaC